MFAENKGIAKNLPAQLLFHFPFLELKRVEKYSCFLPDPGDPLTAFLGLSLIPDCDCDPYAQFLSMSDPGRQQQALYSCLLSC